MSQSHHQNQNENLSTQPLHKPQSSPQAIPIPIPRPLSTLTMDSCFAFPRRNGYREVNSDFPDDPTVTVLVGKERRVFAVDSLVLEEEPLRVLVGMMGRKMRGYDGRDVVFLDDVESLLFEHLLWLVHNNDCPSVVRFHLRDIVDFYAVDC